ncbi:hypothetical protein [Leptospira sp. GIMC2001]|uniref:hypothetical protein n=1 Tax=Leptospira sp. GIMC2001 TaxID=1513297 RepID=UPI00234994D9|nr:hypothetical protein [Leptospira sp. GIMC2001]WCL48243.1 hypothetical protein O4O04_13110 [Leptospira sp. GIMC2001]
MVTNFNINKDGVFSGNGIVPYLVLDNDDKAIDFQNVFQEMLRDVKRLHDVYILSMMDDGKITGRERIQICREMDNFLGDMILLRVILSENRNFFNLTHSQYNVSLEFKILKQRWEATGSMGKVLGLNVSKFRDWMTTQFSKRLKTLLKYTKEALSDNELDVHEKSILISYIEKLIISVIIARHDIYSANLS